MLPADLEERLSRLEALERRFAAELEASKLDALAEFAAGAGHEMNNPLAVITGRVQLILRDETDPERRRDLVLMHAQAMRVHEMIADLMLFARPPAPHPFEFDLARLVVEVVSELQAKPSARQTRLTATGIDRPLSIVADPTQLKVALIALGSNALEAIASQPAGSEGGNVRFALRAVYRAGGDGANVPHAARIVVRDNGPGIEPSARQHLFDPFFSGRGAGRGLGLGLSKCWRIVTQHGGGVRVGQAGAPGAEFIVTLPLAPL